MVDVRDGMFVSDQSFETEEFFEVVDVCFVGAFPHFDGHI